MSLIKKEFEGFPSLSDFFDDNWPEFKMNNMSWSPAINVIDNEMNYEIEVAAPGIKKEGFDVSVENGVLSIVGKTETNEESKDKNYTRREFSSRSFQKRFPIPDNVDPDMVEATHEDGILKIFLHKKGSLETPKKNVQVK